MGGIVSTPKAAAPAPVVQPASPTPAELAAEAEATRLQGEEERAEQLARARRGRSSTVTSSLLGVTDSGDNAPRRKTLLGE